MLPLGVDARNYTLFGHSLHSTLQASTCLYEAMPSYSTPYPGAPLSPSTLQYIFFYSPFALTSMIDIDNNNIIIIYCDRSNHLYCNNKTFLR